MDSTATVLVSLRGGRVHTGWVAAAASSFEEITQVRTREWPKDSSFSGVERLVVRNSGNS